MRKVIKKKNVLINPNEYIEIFSEFGTTIPLADKIYDWKQSVNYIFKLPGQWHFKFHKSKRILFRRSKNMDNVLIKGEPNYNIDVNNYKSICKRNKMVRDIRCPSAVPIHSRVSVLKLIDVHKLLKKHFGDEWQTNQALEFYKNINITESVRNQDNTGCEEFTLQED